MFGTLTTNKPITDKEQLENVTVNGIAYLYAVGAISYVDAFDQPHRTTFCYRWNVKIASRGDKYFFMGASETGNDAN